MESQENQQISNADDTGERQSNDKIVSQAVGQLAMANPNKKSSNPPRKPRRLRAVMVGIVVFVLAVLLVALVWLSAGNQKVTSADTGVKSSEYQALFLTNGQVYFGKLANLDSKYVTITDVYYLQVQQSQSLQQGDAADSSGAQVSLAKLGSELHGPEDKMFVSSQQVLFWENLKDSSKVVQAIQKYQAQQ